MVLTGNTGRLEVYTPDGAQASWAAVVTNIQRSGTSNSVFTLTGTQLNGLDELRLRRRPDGLHFPLVRLTSLQTGAVTYARTANWSLTGVATGNCPETVNFTLPRALPPAHLYPDSCRQRHSFAAAFFVLGTNNGDTVKSLRPPSRSMASPLATARARFRASTCSRATARTASRSSPLRRDCR